MMPTRRIVILCMLGAIALVAPARAGQVPAEHARAITHAKRLFELIREDKMADVAKEFTDEMTAALPPEKISGLMTTINQQAGAFQSYIEEKVTVTNTGHTAVMLGCQFEKNGVNAMFVFDAQEKLAGLQFRPRP